MPRVQCVCGAKYRFDDSALGRRAKCKKCGATFTVAEVVADDGTIPLAPPQGMADEVSSAVHRADQDQQLLSRQQAKFEERARGADSPSIDSRADAQHAGSQKGYWQSVLWSFLFPSVSAGNVFTFLAVWMVLVVVPFGAQFMCLLGLVVILALMGWYAAFRLNIIASAANGEEDLPSPGFSGDYYAELIYPAVQWIGSWIIVTLPALAYLSFAGDWDAVSGVGIDVLLSEGLSGLLSGSGEVGAFGVLLYGGLFMWPMVVLCIALGGFSSLYRIDLIMATIARSFLPYAVTVGLVVGATLIGELAGDVLLAGKVAMGYVLLIGIKLYIEIVTMRVIGLYYHHYKDRFAWSRLGSGRIGGS